MFHRYLVTCALPLIVACGSRSTVEPTQRDAGVLRDGGLEQARDGGATARDGGTEEPSRSGCEAARFRIGDEDPGARGPWVVGARLFSVRGVPAEVWYPAGDDNPAADPIRYDVREQLPASEQTKIPDDENPWQDCDCYRDLPIDETFGPYPLVLFVHGTGGFRTQSLSLVEHWASRGFVVVAMDHPGLYLGDLLQLRMQRDLEGDVAALLAAVAATEGPLAFLDGHVDMDRLGAIGHSAGGNVVGGLSAQARVIVPMAAGGVDPGAKLESVLVLGAVDDQIVSFDRTEDGYDASPTPKALVGLANAGHLAFSDLCALGADDGGLVDIATRNGVANANLASFLWDGCDPGQMPPETSSEITRYVSTTVLEETLQCTGTALTDPSGRFDGVSVFRNQ